ncbi:MAG: hypothetical protein P8074_17700 [Anaerolineales bacterium]|jgi:hypothetical protein
MVADSIRTSTNYRRKSHPWLKRVRVAYEPGPATPLLTEFAENLLEHFREHGHTLLSDPGDEPDVLLTSAAYGKPVNWRRSLFLTARKRFHLTYNPTVFTLMHMTPAKLEEMLSYFKRVLKKEPPDPSDFVFPGLTSQAYHTLYEQGRRGGPILSLERLLQSQAMCVRILLVVGDRHPIEAYTFDLVGAHPRSDAVEGPGFYDDLVLRIATAVSTHEITDHEQVGEPISKAEWESLSTPGAMRRAGIELGRRKFFTEMVQVSNLVSAPVLNEAISNQYSEGCFATWDPELQALITTITGSARPVAKDKLSDDELAVIVAERPDGRGAQVRLVQGKRNDSPSSEAVELIKMDQPLPRITIDAGWGLEIDQPVEVPIARSKLHGHRSVRSYDPAIVEHVYLDSAYYHYPVSCSTEAQARAIQTAFSRSEALNDPNDPRQVVFTILPGHGIVIVEKWVPGKEPFQVMWELMDDGRLEIENRVPQGPLAFIPDGRGKMHLQTM